jgi:hypothetical protein
MIPLHEMQTEVAAIPTIARPDGWLVLAEDHQRQQAMIEAARDPTPVSGLTHNYYRYPARFSPIFVRAVIDAFTAPGDVVLDPFVGGGTTLVEAVARGRHGVGVDISTLATFVSEVKTYLLSADELSALDIWRDMAPRGINMRDSSIHFSDYAEAGYYRYLNTAPTWRLRKAIEQALASALRLPEPRLEAFARCVVLRTAQWALDGRKVLPSVDEFRAMLADNAADMLIGARALTSAALGATATPATVRVLQGSAADLPALPLPEGRRAPRLVVTSPPYPGVHVLYHRWQVDGRKETPAPFWIANRLDGSGAAHYTMGDRKAFAGYFKRLQSALARVAEFCDEQTVFVQVVAFSEPEWQLPRYLQAATEAGLAEARLPILAGERDGRLWRSVPNRRWHADQIGETHGSQEVVLFHRLAS